MPLPRSRIISRPRSKTSAAPSASRIDVEYADGGVVLGDQPGAGLVIDEAAIAGEDDKEASWPAPQGPHVRPRRAGLRLVADDAAESADL